LLHWDDLRFFLAVARQGSMSAAGRALHVSQPTIGRRIAAFEHELGANLFVSVHNGQMLSATGRRLLVYAERMEHDAIAAERAVVGRDAGVRGRVCITASEWLVGSVLGPLIAPFVAKNPELELDLAADLRHLNLARREADIAIRPSRFEQSDVVQQQIGVVAYGLYASDGYLERYGAPDFATHCEGHVLLAMSTSLLTIPDVPWLATYASRARVAARTNGRMPMATMASAGIGIACLPRIVGDKTSSLRLLATPTRVPERKLWLGAHRDVRRITRVKATIAFVANAFGNLRDALDPK
jgi:DNA-binding transcriptional LysR family regulator